MDTQDLGTNSMYSDIRYNKSRRVCVFAAQAKLPKHLQVCKPADPRGRLKDYASSGGWPASYPGLNKARIIRHAARWPCRMHS